MLHGYTCLPIERCLKIDNYHHKSNRFRDYPVFDCNDRLQLLKIRIATPLQDAAEKAKAAEARCSYGSLHED